MTDYELGREGRRQGMAYDAAPYWSWFRRCSWQQGWLDADEAMHKARERKSEQRTRHHPLMQTA